MSHPTENEDFGLLGDSEADTIQLENVPGGPIETEDPRTVGPKKPGRKRKEPAEQQQQQEQEEVVSPPVKRSNRLRGQEQAQKENVPPTEPPLTPAAPAAQTAEEAVFGSGPASVAPPADPQTPHHQPSVSGGLENLGYDQHNPNEMTNFGYTGEGAPTPGAVSMGGATPYR